jgi:hypothetical protein
MVGSILGRSSIKIAEKEWTILRQDLILSLPYNPLPLDNYSISMPIYIFFYMYL